MMFRDQVGVLSSWFKAWNECEQTVALLSLLKRVSRTQARFLQLCLDHSLAACTELQSLEREANDPAYVGQWWQESHNKAMALLLSHFPLLKPSNVEAKAQYMRLLPKVLAHCIESGQQVEESRQLLSYALIHPAISMEDRGALAGWFSHLEDRVGTMGASTSFSPEQTDLPGFGLDCQSQQTAGATGKPNGWSSHRAESGWPEGAQTSETSQQSRSSSVSSPSYSNSGNTNTSLTQRSASLTPPVSLITTNHGGIPTSQPPHLDWLSQGPPFPSSTGTSVGGDTVSLPPHAPLSPQSSVASSGSGGSELADDFISIPGSGRNTFREEGSGMKDVPAWLKSLRLHKYARLFSQLTYPEMMSLTEQKLETQNVTKGARHKIVLSIMKLKERPQTLQALEKDVLEGGNIRNALTELHQVIGTPIPTNMTCPGAVGVIGSNEALLGVVTDSGSPGQTASIIDLPGQITRVVGKVCTQLLVSRPDEENVASYLQLLDKCLAHEAFTETQKKRLLSWKQQVQKLFRGFPRKPMEIRQPGRSWSLFGQPLQLPPGAPMVGFGVGGMAWRGQRALPLPPRNIANTARLGLLATNPRPSALSKAVWYGASGGSNSMPSRNHSSVQRTRSLPVHTSPNAFMLFQQTEFQVPVTEPEINNRLESLCLSMMEHALGDGVDRTSTI